MNTTGMSFHVVNKGAPEKDRSRVQATPMEHQFGLSGASPSQERVLASRLSNAHKKKLALNSYIKKAE